MYLGDGAIAITEPAYEIEVLTIVKYSWFISTINIKLRTMSIHVYIGMTKNILNIK